MSKKLFCPNCNGTHDVTKKGTDKLKRQRWKCKSCLKSFTEGILYSSLNEQKNSSKKPKESKEKNIKIKPVTEKHISRTIVNVNAVTYIDFPNDMTKEEAFSAMQSSHKGISLNSCNVNIADDIKIINFRIIGGKKG